VSALAYNTDFGEAKTVTEQRMTIWNQRRPCFHASATLTYVQNYANIVSIQYSQFI